MKKLIKKLIIKFTLQTPSVLNNFKNNLNLDTDDNNNEFFLNQKINDEIIKKLHLKKKTFGKLNEDKIFYVIKRSPGTGMFSNITFILNHLKICKQYKFIPIIDMENFSSIYNERINFRNNFNAWNYYFENLNNYSLSQVYQSKNVLITDNKFFNFFSYNIDKDSELAELLNSEIKVNKYIEKCYTTILKKFKNKKVLGIHFRVLAIKDLLDTLCQQLKSKCLS